MILQVELQCRKANLTDIPQLIELRKRQLLDEGSVPDCDIDGELAEYFASGLTDKSFAAWVAEEGRKIIATGGVCFYRLPPSFSNPTGWVAYITNVFTRKEYRRRGLATALVTLAIREAKTRGCEVIRLHASSDGRPVYSRLGFTDSGGYMTLRV